MHVALFFTRGVSLRTWDEVGMFEREVALYRRLYEWGVDVTFVTHGDGKDLSYSDRIPGIKILCNRHGLSSKAYRMLLPFIHFRDLRRASYFKTNQTDGGELALRAARVVGRPLIARCGYMLSEFQSRKFGVGSRQAIRSLRTEKKVFSGADKVVVTTEVMKTDITGKMGVDPEKIKVIPNYVDTGLFKPQGESLKEFDMIFVGRIAPQKNLDRFLEAVEPLGLKVLIIGNGPLKGELKRRYGDNNGPFTWIDTVPNQLLPDYLGRSKIFVLPSLYEGHPKTLIEAMAMGMPVLGTDVPGIKEVINHGDNGWLCRPEVASLRAAMKSLISDTEKHNKLGESARRTVEMNYSLDQIVDMEINLIRDLLKNKRRDF
jgi:glycosyltransferase involved in cell wall biosynthesis